MLILLIGPKGSGKSHIGRLLERELGVHFFHVEPHWMAYYAACREAGREPSITEGIGRIHPETRSALERHPRVCVETTGASDEILQDLLSIGAERGLLLVRVNAPLAVCLERIRNRDPTHQIPVDDVMIERIYGASSVVDLTFDVILENDGMTDSEIVAVLRHKI